MSKIKGRIDNSYKLEFAEDIKYHLHLYSERCTFEKIFRFNDTVTRRGGSEYREALVGRFEEIRADYSWQADD